MNLSSAEIINALDLLKADHKPVFGKMSAQHMVEHLTITLKLSIGKIQYPPFTPSEKALKVKNNLLFTAVEMGMGMTPPNDSGKLTPLKYPTLEIAKEALINAWDEFQAYYKHHRESKHVHPRFGYLDYDEWNRFHFKHFMHHFKQFEVWGG